MVKSVRSAGNRLSVCLNHTSALYQFHDFGGETILTSLHLSFLICKVKMKNALYLLCLTELMWGLSELICVEPWEYASKCCKHCYHLFHWLISQRRKLRSREVQELAQGIYLLSNGARTRMCSYDPTSASLYFLPLPSFIQPAGFAFGENFKMKKNLPNSFRYLSGKQSHVSSGRRQSPSEKTV